MLVVSDRARALWRRANATRGGQVGLVAALFVVGWPLAATLLPKGAPIGVVLQGVAYGAITGLLGIGLILTYRTNRIINFAYASMGGVGGVLAVHLYQFGPRLPYGVAIAIGVATGLAVGGLVEVLVIRRFRNASRLVLTVATIGLAQVLGGIELIIPTWFDSAGLIGGFDTPLSDINFRVHPVLIDGNHMLMVGSVVPIIAALAWFLLRTDSGVAVRAAAENRDRALLLGIPIQRLTTLVWIIVGGLAALTAILRAPFSGSVSTALGGPTLLLPALAAAVVGRMELLPRAFIAGIGLGIVEQVVFFNTAKASSIDVAFLAVIVIALLAQKDMLNRAQEAGDATWSMAEAVRRVPIELRRLPEVRVPKYALLAVLGAVVLWLPHTVEASDLIIVNLALIWAMVGVSLVVLTGWAGNISLGQFAIVGIAAVFAGNMFDRFNLDLFLVILLSGAFGGGMALLLGVPALRIRGLFLAVTTLSFAVAFDRFFLSATTFPTLINTGVPRPMLFGGRWDAESDLVMYHLILGLLVLSILLVNSVRGTRSGRVLIATRDNHRAASAAAVAPTAAKLTGFVFSGVIAGIAGCLMMLQLHGTAEGTFSPAMSLEVFSTAVIGGLGTVFGALLGVLTFRWLEQVMSGEARLIVAGSGLLFVLMVIPGGLSSLVFGWRDRYLRWVARRRGIPVPSLTEDKRVEDEEAEEEGPAEVDFGEVLDATSAADEAATAEVVVTKKGRSR